MKILFRAAEADTVESWDYEDVSLEGVLYEALATELSTNHEALPEALQVFESKGEWKVSLLDRF